MASKIDTVTGRNKLKVRREPYWHRLSSGFYIGFRKMSDAFDGAWLTRYPGKHGHEIQRSLGPLSKYLPHERFDKAVEVARELVSRSEPVPDEVVESITTVMDACDAYRFALHWHP